jgi:hypothetical protein
MHHLVYVIRELKSRFKTPDKKPHIALAKAVEQGKVKVKINTAEEAWKAWQESLNIHERR